VRRVRVDAAPPELDTLTNIRTERLRAKAEGRVLVVYVGASWCGPCRRLHAALDSGALGVTLSNTKVLAFDADRDRDRLLAAGYSFQYLPFVALPASDGTLSRRPRRVVLATKRGANSPGN
jgi:thiol-disulfide isomerase/thioredoxin